MLLASLYHQIGEEFFALLKDGKADNPGQAQEKSLAFLRQSVELFRGLMNQRQLADVLSSLGRTLYFFGDYQKAKKCFLEALEIGHNTKDSYRTSHFLSWLGPIERQLGNWDSAKDYMNQYLVLSEELGDRSGMATSWGQLGDIERNRGNWDAAEALFRKSLVLREELGDRSGMATSWGQLGDIEHHRGNWDDAKSLHQQALSLRQELGDQAGVLEILLDLGKDNVACGDLKLAQQQLEDIIPKLSAQGMKFDLGRAYKELFKISNQIHQDPQASEYYQQAYEIFSTLGAKKELEELEQLS